MKKKEPFSTLKIHQAVILMNNMEYEISNGTAQKMTPERINLHRDGYVTQNHDRIDADQTSKISEVNSMEVTPKEYIDSKISSLESSLEQKFEHQQSLFSEKMNHMQTKTEKAIGEKFTTLKEQIEGNRKEDKKFYVTTAMALAAVVVGVLGFIF